MTLSQQKWSWARGLFVLLMLAGCMAKVENEDSIQGVTITSHDIDRNGGEAKITLHGSCPKTTSALKIDIDSSIFDVMDSSMTNPSAYVASSGVPIGECNNGVLTIEYPVPNPSQAPRIINFKVKAKMPDGKLSLYAAIRNVEYILPAETLAGFEVCSGGSFSTTGAVTINATAGLPYTGKLGTFLISGGTANLRAGLQGLLYSDSF